MKKRMSWQGVIAGLLFVVWLLPLSAQQSDELEALQEQIKAKQQALDEQLQQARSLQATLQAQELKIAASARALNETQIALADNRQRQKALTERQRTLTTKLQQQKSLLAQQLRSAFMAGNHDYAKMLLNQENAGRLERVITYYQYLNKARQEQISTFQELGQQLEEVTQSLKAEQQELQSLQQDQQRQQQQLSRQQQDRQKTLLSMERQIDSEAAQIEQLQINEQALLKALEMAERESQRRPVSLGGLAAMKGKLLKPTQGRMRNLFGKRRQGQVRWKGTLISGNEGNAVRAVHDGKVLFADWLRGFGLVTVVDHGQGYMSLYGHNQALLKQAGDSVEAGDTIALVGQSGGQSSPNLYFEIRHKGRAINPRDWIEQ